MKLVQSYVCTGSYYAQLEWTPRPFRLKKYVLYYTLFVYKTCGILFMYYLLAKHCNAKRDFITFLAPQQVGTKQNSTKKLQKMI